MTTDEKMVHIRQNFHNYVGMVCTCGKPIWADIGTDDDRNYFALKCHYCGKRFWLDDADSMRMYLEKELLEKFDNDLDKVLESEDVTTYYLVTSSNLIPKPISELLNSMADNMVKKDG